MRHIPLSVQLGVLVALVMVLTAGLGYGTKSASASGTTQIILSHSNTQPVPATIVVVPPGESKMLYVWAVNVKDPTGLSGAQVDLHFRDASFNVFSMQMHSTWLASTGRSVSCSPPPTIENDRAYGSCNSIGQASPPGPTGSGLLATIGLLAAPTIQPSSTLNLKPVPPHNGSFLLSTPPSLDVKVIEGVEIVNASAYHKCADNNGDGIVDLFGDILSVISRFGMEDDDPDTWPQGLTWNWAHDLNEDGTIDLFIDILGTIAQFNVACTQT